MCVFACDWIKKPIVWSTRSVNSVKECKIQADVKPQLVLTLAIVNAIVIRFLNLYIVQEADCN